MEQLVNMGFSEASASEALDATGGDIIKATDWLLNRPPPSKSPKPGKLQPKINVFYKDNSEIDDSPKQQPKIDCFYKDNEVDDSPKPQPPPPSQPLAERMRPQTLDQVVGQDHVLGPTCALSAALRRGRIPSLLLWGPPGSGKTCIARAIGNSNDASEYRFVQISAVNAGVKDVRDAVDEAKMRKRKRAMKTIVFIDEVHRFNKAQQDSLLPVIEDGSIVFIGATTENPSFHVITPLLSRCTLLALNPLQPNHIAIILSRAVVRVPIEDEAIQFLANHCDGDARVALNALEIAANMPTDSASVSVSHAREALQSKHVAYDRDGEEHYNLISALHKSMRGSDPDASIYWLARMLEGGENPLYIARRLIRFASEDVGLADPSALVQAVACYQACHFIGMPECNANLAQCVCYLALAPKSISVYTAIGDAQKMVRESAGQNQGVPLHLRNAPTKLMKDIGYGKGYVYPPHSDAHQTYMPPSLQGHKFLDWPPNYK